MTWIVILLCVYCIFAPARYDPAIRLKYWAMGKKFGDNP